MIDAYAAEARDATVCTEMLEMLGADVYVGAIRSLTGRLPVALQALRMALENGDAHAVFRVVHTLKCSFGSIGLSRANRVLSDMEFMALERRLESIGLRMGLLERWLTRDLTALEEWIGVQSALPGWARGQSAGHC